MTSKPPPNPLRTPSARARRFPTSCDLLSEQGSRAPHSVPGTMHGHPARFRWLFSWYVSPELVEKRGRGAFFCRKIWRCPKKYLPSQHQPSKTNIMKQSTTKGATSTPIEDTPRQKCYKKLMQLEKTALADLAAGIIDLAFHLAGNEEETFYGQGWNDSRRSLILLCNLRKYYSHD